MQDETKLFIQGMYVAYWGRPGDPPGVTYWTNQYELGYLTFTGIGENFAASAEGRGAYEYFHNYFTFGANALTDGMRVDFIQKVYQNLFNREADQEGLEYWLDVLVSGASSPGAFISFIIDSAWQEREGVSSSDWSTLNNKIQLAGHFTDELIARDKLWNQDLSNDMAGLLTTVDKESDLELLKSQVDALISSVRVVGQTFTLADIAPEVETVFYYNDIRFDTALDYFAKMAGLDLVDLGIIDTNGQLLANNDVSLAASMGVSEFYITTTDDPYYRVEGQGQAVVEIVFADGRIITTREDVSIAYLEMLREMILDPDLEETLTATYGTAVLTPTQNNGVVEPGFTTKADNTIVAGRLELLHGAYLDGGGGSNTLEIDAKGLFAQPKQLLNIQNVTVQNMTNVYPLDVYPFDGVDFYSDANIEESIKENFDNVNFSYPLPSGLNANNSIVDLSRAVDLEKLVVTEAGNFGQFGSGNDLGSLTVMGIRGGVTTRLEGGFSEDVYLHYGSGQTSAVTLELMLGDTEGMTFYVAHNTNSLNLVSLSDGTSKVSENWLENGYFGGSIREMNISGDAALYIEGDLTESFHAGRPALIDASENTAGVDLVFRNDTGKVVKDIQFIGSSGDDRFEVRGTGSDNIVIDGGVGNNKYFVAGREITVAGNDGNDQVTVSGENSDFSSKYFYNPDAALLNIDTGAGQNLVTFGNMFTDYGHNRGVMALEGSVITGENITLRVDFDSDLTLAQELSGIEAVKLIGELAITSEQFVELGPELFSAFHKNDDVFLTIQVGNDFNMTGLDLSGLGKSVYLSFDVLYGATLTLTAEQLHKYVLKDGIVLGPENGMGKVVVTDAGFNFNVYDNGWVGAPEFSYFKGGTIDNNWPMPPNANVTVIRNADGFDRPSLAEYDDAWIIDSSDMALTFGANDLGDKKYFNLVAEKMIIQGENDVTFTAPVQFANKHAFISNFTIDFSNLEGDLNGLTIANFDRITSGNNPADWGKIIGNGNDVRIDVIMGDNEDALAPSLVQLLQTEGVAQYVVVNIEDATNTAVIRLSDESKDVEVLGLQGNAGKALAYIEVPFGLVSPEFLMEGDGVANWNETVKADGNPNESNIGSLVVSFFQPGAPAVVNIDNQGVALGVTSDGSPRPLAVDGILFENAGTATINVADGNAIIADFIAPDISSLTLTGEEGVAVWLNNDSGADDWTSIDATGVVGNAVIGIGAFDGSFNPAEFLGENVEIDLSQVAMTGVDLLAIAPEASLTLNLEQFTSIGILATNPDEALATLHLVDLSDEEFSLGLLPEGIVLGSLTVIAEEEVTLNELTDLTGVEQLKVLEGTSLTMSMEQYNQLTGNEVGVKIIGDGTVNITGITQELLAEWPDFATGIEAEYGELTLAEDEVVFGLREFGVEVEAVDLGGFAIILGENQHITFTNPDQAHERVVVGDGLTSKVSFAFRYDEIDGQEVDFEDLIEKGLDLSGYEGLVEINVWEQLVQGQNVEQILGLLTDQSIVVINATPDAELRSTHREVVVQPGVVVLEEAGNSLIFEDLRKTWGVETLDITLLGGNEIKGAVDVSDIVQAEVGGFFKKMTINSLGDDSSSMGNLLATGNNLLDVEINAESELEVGTITFSSVNEDAAAVFTVNGDADVTLKSLNTTDVNVDVLTVNSNLTGGATLTVTGGSPAAALAATEGLILAGEGDIVFGTEGVGVDGGGVLSLINAAALEGDLDLGVVQAIDSADFAFIAGTGVTSLTLQDAELNADVDADETGWSFDFSLAAAGSRFELGEGIDWTAGPLEINLGANTELYISESADLTDLDLTIMQTLPIVLGEGVELKLTAAQASGLTIIPDASIILDVNDPDYDAALVPVVNITMLGIAAYDFSGIDEAIAGSATLAMNDVTLNENTDLGAFAIELEGLGNDFGDGQTIRFQNVDQAARVVTVEGMDTDGTNVVWLFNDPALIPAGGVDTSGYSGDIGRLWINDQLADGQNIEQLFTWLPDSIIRIEFTGDLPDALGNFIGIQRKVEIVAFTELENGLSFSDEEEAPFVENLQIDLGGEVVLGDLLIDNVVGPDLTGTANFNVLTINSFRATAEGSRLMPEDWEQGVNALPFGANEIGDIASGPVQQLLNVTLNTEAVLAGETDEELTISSITFDRADDVLTDATLVVNGDAAEVTIDNLVLTDPSLTNADTDTIVFNISGSGILNVTEAITIDGAEAGTMATLNTNLAQDASVKEISLGANVAAFNLNNNGAGTLTVTGGSQALTGSALTTLTLAAAFGGIVVGGPVDGSDDVWGVDAENLTELDISGNEGVVVYLENISGEEFTLVDTGTGNNQIWLQSVELDVDGEWTFNFNQGASTTVGLTESATFGAGTLNFTGSGPGNGTILIQGEVDLTNLVDLNVTAFTDLTIVLAEGATLILTPEQLDYLNPLVNFDKTADDTTIIVEGEGDLTGLVLDDADELVMTGDATITKAQYEQFYDNDAEEANIEKPVGAELTLALVNGEDISELDTDIVDVILPDDGATVTLSVEQAGKLAPEDAPDYTYEYNLNDTWANLSDPANEAIVLGSGTHTISDYDELKEQDLGNISIIQALILVTADNYDAGDAPDFGVLATWAEMQQFISDAVAEEPAGNVAEALEELLKGNIPYDITDLDTADLDDLSIVEAAVLLGAESYVDEPYSISDNADQIFDGLTNNYLTSIFGVDIADIDQVVDLETLLEGAVDVEAFDLTVGQQGVLDGNPDINLVAYTLRDTFANLAAAAAVVDGADSYEISDIDDPAFVDFSDDAKAANVAQAILLGNASNFADYELEFWVKDTAANFFDGNNFEEGLEAALQNADNVNVTTAVNASQALKLADLPVEGDALSYDIVATAATIAAAIEANTPDVFKDADSITHTGVGTVEDAIGTNNVEDTFRFAATAGTEATDITNFEVNNVAEGFRDVLDLTTFGFTPSGDLLLISPAAVNNADLVLDGSIHLFINSLLGDLTDAGDVATAFGANVIGNTGDADQESILMIRGAANSYIWHWNDDSGSVGNNDNRVDAAELTLLGVLNGVSNLGDFDTANFA